MPANSPCERCGGCGCGPNTDLNDCRCGAPWGPCECADPTDRTVSRIVIERFLTSDGADLVHVATDDMSGNRLPVVEALGLLQLAIYDVCNSPAGDADDDD
jgi:hypothetical protein